MAQYFRLASPQSLAIRPRTKPPLTVTRLMSNVGLPERTAIIPPEAAFVVSVHLTPAAEQGCDIWVDDRHARIREWPAGGVGIYDLESNPRARNRGPVDWVHYHVPRSMLDAFADDAEVRRIRTIACIPGAVDPALLRMTQLILTSIETPSCSELFLDYFRLLFCAHVTEKYAPSVSPASRHRGGLAPWQRRRAMQLMAEQLPESIRLSTLARECGLSMSHFARSFRRSFGTSAHQYLLRRRIEKAKELLTFRDGSLSDVALLTGFADQAAFSRTFKALVGSAPGQWRREHAHRQRSIRIDGNTTILERGRLEPTLGSSQEQQHETSNAAHLDKSS
jgi:AraC-like DNA-binding protein